MVKGGYPYGLETSNCDSTLPGMSRILLPCSRMCLRSGPLSFLSTTCHVNCRVNHVSSSVRNYHSNRSTSAKYRMLGDFVRSTRMMSCLAGLVEDAQGLFGRRHLLRRTLDIGEGGDQPLKLLAKGVGQTHAAAQHVAKSQLVLEMLNVLPVVLVTCTGHQMNHYSMVLNTSSPKLAGFRIRQQSSAFSGGFFMSSGVRLFVLVRSSEDPA